MTDFNAPGSGSSENGEPAPLEMPLEIETAMVEADTSYIAAEPAPKRKVRVMALAIGLVAAMGAGAFAVTQLGDTTDGADSPRAALDRMISAINSSDILGVFEALPPGERSAMLDPIKNINTELQRVGIVSKDNDLKSFNGAGIKITGIEATTTNLSDTVASVDIRKAKVESSFDISKLPIGDELKKLAFKDGVPTGSGAKTGEKVDGDPIHLMAIKEGGGWHMSMFYSAADGIRRAAKAPNPDFTKSVKAVGGDTPEAAANEMLTALGAIDIRRLIELMPPDEMRALHDYAPLFLDSATKAIGDFKAKTPFEVTFTGTEFKSTTTGDQAMVQAKSFAVQAKISTLDVSIKTEGKCGIVDVKNTKTGETQTYNSCDTTKENASTKKLTDAVANFQSSLNLNDIQAGLMFVQRGGKWFFSPTRTILDVYVSLLKVLNQDSIEKGVTGLKDLLNSNPLFGQLTTRLTSQTTIAATPIDPPLEPSTTVAPSGLSEAALAAIDTCTTKATSDAGTSTGPAFTKAMMGCLQPLFSNGTIDPNYVALETVAPNCYVDVNALIASKAAAADIQTEYFKAKQCAQKQLQPTP